MNTLLAACMFFTRLPFWKIKEVPSECFKSVVNYWAYVGWLTGGVMALILWLSSFVLPFPVAVILALCSRLLITGALHEDGLADFMDGFGGGTDRTRILAIMKDSHIGSYGVIGLIIYFLFLYTMLCQLPLYVACIVLLAGDCWSKFVASNLINFLPYARKEEDSKAKMVYKRMSVRNFFVAAMGGGLWVLILLPGWYCLACFLPVLVFGGLVWLMWKKIQGYTGDCCGATFLLCELSFYFGINILYRL